MNTAPLLVHPFANLLPPVSAARREKLVAELLSNGQRVRIVLCQGMILDGRARHDLLSALRKKIEYREFSGSEHAALRRVIYGNFHRLSEHQKAVVFRKVEALLIRLKDKPLLNSFRMKFGVAR